MNLVSQIENALVFAPPAVVETRSGNVCLRVAKASKAFWDIWTEHKDEVRALGYRPAKRNGGEWTVSVKVERDPEAEAQGERPVAEIVLPELSNDAGDGRRWSEEQMEIFRWFREGRGSLVVRARAGTGKTTTIKEAFRYAPERNALYCVFNRKNSIEAQAALKALAHVDVMTLHKLGFAYIKRVWPEAKPDEAVEWERVQLAVGDGNMSVGASVPDEVHSAVHKLVALSKNILVWPSLEDLVDLAEDRGIDAEAFEAKECGGWEVGKLAACALRVLSYSRAQDPQNRISFNDMVWLPCAMEWVRPWFSLVVVDEAQDMNAPQLLMARQACKPDGRICVVGDDRQAIYGFRGAVQDGLNMMRRELDAAVLGLTLTYRCPRRVVALANSIVSDYRAADAAPEGVVDYVAEESVPGLVQIGDAILSRTNAPLMPICLALLRAGVPARIEGREVGKALLAIVKKLKARSVPNFLEKVESWSAKQKRRYAKIKNLEAKMREIEDQAGVLVAVADGASSVSDIERRLESLFSNVDDNPRPSVVLSTVHKAKGLEWNKVVLLAATFMKKRPGQAEVGQEEQNIFYVAMTRAKSHLVFAGEQPSCQG